MKKIILTFFGILISFSAGAAVNIVNAISTDEELIEKLFTEAGVSSNFDNEPGELTSLGDGEIPFNNVYLFMYKNVREGPKEAAIEALSLDPSYSAYGVENLEKILIDGDLSPMREVLDDTITQIELVEKYTGLQNDYEEELEFQMENRKLSYEALATEIFMNNDLSDSANVDLLFDLDIINYLLFGQYIEYPDRSGTESVELASEDDGNYEKTTLLAKVSGKNSENSSDSIFSKYGLKKVRRASEESSVDESDDAEKDGSADSELICKEDEELSAAIDEYEESATEEEETEEDSDESEDDQTENDDQNDEDDTSDDGDEDVDDDAESSKPSVDEFVNSIAGNLGNWDRELPCNETFCITVELIAGDDENYSEDEDSESYEPEENCIACHTQFLLKRLEETVSKQLATSKISMNWGEDGTCKEAGKLIDVDLNVYTILKPIFTDPGDDIEEEAENNVNVLIGKLKENGILQPSEDLNGVTQNEYEATRILNTFENATHEDILERITDANEVRQAAIEEAIEDFTISVKGQNSILFQELVISELSTFRSYFSNFQIALQDSLEPLQAIADKKYCSQL